MTNKAPFRPTTVTMFDGFDFPGIGVMIMGGPIQVYQSRSNWLFMIASN